MSHPRREQFVRQPSKPPQMADGLSWQAAIIAASIVLFGVVLLVLHYRSMGTNPFADTGRGGDISIPLSEFADGQARFYTYTTASGKQIRFFIMRSADGVTRAAFDTCDVCYRERRGYRQSGSQMICNNCEQAFASTSINELRGGCNPAPLDRAIVGDRLVLRAQALEQGAFYF